MPHLRISEAARFIGVSDDTLRRRINDGALATSTDSSDRTVVDGAELAAFAKSQASVLPSSVGPASSARNRFTGLVTEVISDTVMSQVELQCGPYRVVSLMSTESVRELELKPGSIATASIKATHVVVETRERAHVDPHSAQPDAITASSPTEGDAP